MTSTPDATLPRPPAWVSGHVSADDARFLDHLVRELRPSAVIEIGVAAGCSSATILRALVACGPDSRLHSFDLAATCYFATERPVGSAVDEMFPAGRAIWELHLGKTAVDAGAMLSGRDVPLAFIDAAHSHPWPALDLLALVPALAPGAWVALHDVFLARWGMKPVFGPEYLFRFWPGEKRACRGRANIAAIRIPADRAQARAWILSILAEPWHVPIDAALLDALAVPAATTTAVTKPLPGMLGPQLQLRAVAAAARPILIWGAGVAGRACLAQLRARGLAASGFIDRDPAKHASEVDGLCVCSPDTLTLARPRPFVVAASMYASSIEEHLQRQGWEPEADFCRFDIPTAEFVQAGSGPAVVAPPLLGMTTPEEQAYLRELARRHFFGAGEIVDLGCWLGSTTISLASGLAHNPRRRARRVHAYDRFIWYDRWRSSAGDMASTMRQGQSFRAEFESRLGGLRDHVVVNEADLTQTTWNGGPIEILVVDAMKNWRLCSAITRNFFPAVIPGCGLVVHQDFKFWGCPWIHLTMYRLRDLFALEADLAYSGSTVFRLLATPPAARVSPELAPADFPVDEIDAAYAYWRGTLSKPLQVELECARVLALSEAGAVAQARDAFATLLNARLRMAPAFLENIPIRAPGLADLAHTASTRQST